MQTLILTMAFSFITVGVVTAISPLWTRKHLQFGVTFPEDARLHPKIRALKKRFFWANLMATVFFMLPMFAGFLLGYEGEQHARFLSIMGTGGISALALFGFFSYVAAHGAAKKIKQAHFPSPTPSGYSPKLMVSTNFRNEKMAVPTGVFVFWGLGIVALTAFLPFAFWERIPAQIPVHWGADGEITRWADKSIRSVLMLPLFQLLIFPVLVWANHALKKSKQVLDPKRAQVSMEQNQAFRLAWSRFLVFTGLSTLGIFLALQTATLFAIQSANFILWGTLIWMAALTFYAVKISVKYGQGGEKWQPKGAAPIASQEPGILDNDNFWKLGLFYYNPSDPAIYVERRFGIGVTFNFARWQAWAMTGAIALLCVISILIPVRMM
ncbi:MAG: DUF1648 domain-containing protein [Turicibacter sp.]|nr:DUF1648 domain-containing protein [Turicibacter sp.]